LAKFDYSSAIRVAVVSLILCGLLFPLVVTGFAQVLMPQQANGSIIIFHGHAIGSDLVAQNFNSSMFFHPWNASASGVDPDITLQDAYSQILGIHAATGIPIGTLKHLVDENVERTMFIAGDPYVNVLRLNLILIQEYPSIYTSYA